MRPMTRFLPTRLLGSAGFAAVGRRVFPRADLTLQRLTLAAAVVGADEQQSEAVGQQFVVGEPVARLRVLAAMRKNQRVAPRRPLMFVEQAWLDPLG